MLRKSVFALATIAALVPGLYIPAQGDQSPEQQTRELEPGKIYAQQLVDRTVARHAELIELDLHVRPPEGAESVIVAAKSSARIGKKTDRDDLDVAESGAPFVEINKFADQNVEVHLPLLDAGRKVIGTIEVTFAYPPGSGLDKDALIRAGALIRDEMSRQIRSAPELFTSVLADPQIPAYPYAQLLIDNTVARRRDVLAMAMHVQRPAGGTDYPIIASSIGHIGKLADDDDMQVISSGETHLESGKNGDRLEVKTALQDASGQIVGALSVVFPYDKGDDQAALQASAEKLRDELRPRIPNAAALYESRPVESAPSVIARQLDKTSLGNRGSLAMTKEVTSSAALQNAQEGLTDATKNQAGVAPTNSKGSPADAQAIRGIKLNLFSNYRLNGGLAIAGITTTPIEDKERIETLKGANALMFGVASPAGIINLVTKRATRDDINSVSVLGSAFGQYGMAVDLGRRYGAEKQFGVRVNLSGTHLENGVRGANGEFGFASVGSDWKITDRLTAQVDLETYRKDVIEQGSVSLPTVVNGQLTIPRVPDPRNLLSGSWAKYSALTTNYQGRVDYRITSDLKVLVEAGESDADRSRNTARISGYDINTGANGTVTVNTVTQKYFNKFARTELLDRFDTGPLKHDLTIGVAVSVRPAETPAQNTIVLPEKTNIYDPVVLPTPVPTAAPTSLRLQSDKDIGFYTYDTVGIGAKLKVLLGFREIRSLANDGVKSSGTYVPAPAFGALYDILPTTTLFASYMKGLEDGGVGPVNSVNAYQILAPAVSTQEEVGIRDSYFKGLSVSASVFDITRANAVINAATKIFSNDGTIEYRGAESVIKEEIDRQWSIAAAAQWLDAVQHPDSDMTISHRPPENTPKWIGNFSLTNRPSLLPGLSLTASTSFVSKRAANPQNQGFISGYELLGLGAGYETRIGGKRASFLVNADNVLNKRYWNSVQTGTLGTGMDTSVRMSARIDF